MLMCFIFFWHIIVHGLGIVYSGHFRITCADDTALLFATIVFSPAVDCFIFISGFYGIHFSLKRLSLLVVACVYAMFVTSIKYFWFDGFQLLALDPFGPWWFVNCYLVVFMVAPAVNRGLESLTITQFRCVVVVLLLFQLHEFLCFHSGSSVTNLLTIYILGRYCAIYGVKPRGKQSAIIYSASLAILFLALLLLKGKGLGKTMNYNNPLIILMAMSLFYVFLSLRPRSIGWLNVCLRPCLFIYLLTEGVFTPLYKYVARMFTCSFVNGAVLSFAIIIVSLVIGYVLQRLAQKTVSFVFKNHWLKWVNDSSKA